MLDPLSILIPTSHGSSSNTPRLPRRYLLTPSEDHPDDYLLHLDYSHGLSAFMECPRKWQNLNIHAREANRPTVAKDFGTAFHAAEELRLREGYSQQVHDRQVEMVRSFFLAHPVPTDEYRNCDRLLEVLGQYNKLHGDDGWPEAVVEHRGEKAVELAFKLEFATVAVNSELSFFKGQLMDCANVTTMRGSKTNIRNLHIVFTGKIDAVLAQNNVLFVVDHKTSSRGGKEFEDAFRLSLQTRGYCWAAQKILGREVAGLVMNAVVVRPKTKTGVGTEFNRHTYFYPSWSLDEWEQNVHATVEDIVASLSRGYFPQTSRSFKSPCAGCDFHENCALPPKDREFDLASSLYSDVTWSPTNEVE